MAGKLFIRIVEGDSTTLINLANVTYAEVNFKEKRPVEIGIHFGDKGATPLHFKHDAAEQLAEALGLWERDNPGKKRKKKKRPTDYF